MALVIAYAIERNLIVKPNQVQSFNYKRHICRANDAQIDQVNNV